MFPWALAVAIPTMAGTLISPTRWDNLASFKGVLIAVLWLWFTITSISSVNTSLFVHHAADTWYEWRVVSKIFLMTGVTIAIVNSFARLRILVLVIAGCFGVFVLKAFVFIVFTGGAYRLYGPENSMIADNNDFGLALNMTLPLFCFLAQTEAKRWARLLCGCLFVITIPAVFFTYSRGAMVGLIVVLGMMFFQLKRRLILIPIITLAIVVAFVLAPQSWQERMDPTRADAVDASAKSRLNAWTFSWNLASDYPIAGGGFATFTQELFDRYAPKSGDVHGPHSIYFGVLAEHGFVGLALYLALVFSAFRGTRRVRNQARLLGDETAAHYASMFQFSLVGFLTSGAFLGRAYFDYFFLIIACTAILQEVCEREWVEQDSTELVIQPEEQMA